MAGFVSPRLGIRFEPGDGPDNLAIFGPDGQRFLTFTEWVEKSKAEERRAAVALKRALAAEERADAQASLLLAERQSATAANERAERFAARLRELGIEPE